ncbi:hypothetical protein EV188_110220 [Actinomycetospora succinea]|uniref:Uncharacterized protein n=1 Tax=Actinomycetospora succinea TaxID=663603 RepID=A0A4R6UWG0_9PSEU|nr:DUF5995 family protein [Actinomycetospora succinea]TDQ50223.1 hypothetical protein EV188_110220 [Actinomycetospora succinea]
MPDPLEENKELLKPLAAQRPRKIEEVVAVLHDIREVADQLPGDGDRDGIACFTDLYHTITVDVLEKFEAGGLFFCKDFIVELDVQFALRYLRALDSWLLGRATPRCWEILFERRRKDRGEWRFAATGVNAHVNFDLAFALLDVWEQHPDDPLSAEREQRADYQAINKIFRDNMDQLCEDHDAPWTLWPTILEDGGWVDRAFNLGGDMLVRRTRDVAWREAAELWPQREREGYRDDKESELDRSARTLAGLFI